MRGLSSEGSNRPLQALPLPGWEHALISLQDALQRHPADCTSLRYNAPHAAVSVKLCLSVRQPPSAISPTHRATPASAQCRRRNGPAATLLSWEARLCCLQSARCPVRDTAGRVCGGDSDADGRFRAHPPTLPLCGRYRRTRSGRALGCSWLQLHASAPNCRHRVLTAVTAHAARCAIIASARRSALSPPSAAGFRSMAPA